MHNEVNIPSKKWKCSILHKRCPFFSAEQTVRRWTSLGGLVLPAKIVAKFSVKVKVFRWWKTTKWSWLAPVTNEPSTSLAGKECVERTEEYWLQNWVCALFLLATLYTSWTVCLLCCWEKVIVYCWSWTLKPPSLSAVDQHKDNRPPACTWSNPCTCMWTTGAGWPRQGSTCSAWSEN